MGILETIIVTVIVAIIIIIFSYKTFKIKDKRYYILIVVIVLSIIVSTIINKINSGEINIIEMIFKD